MTAAAWPQSYVTQAGTLFLSYEETTDTTNTGTGATFTKDTSIARVGSASLKVVTGAGNIAEVRKQTAGIPATWGGKIGVLFYVPDYTKVSQLAVYMASESAYTNFLLGTYNLNAASANHYNGWHYFEMGIGSQSFSKWAVGGGSITVNTAIADMKVRVTPQAGEVATVYLDAFYYSPKQRAKLLVMLDDGWSSGYDNGVAYLDTLGMKCTLGIIGSLIDSGASYMTSANLATAYAAGHDLCVHGETNLSTLTTTDQIIAEVSANRDFLTSRGYTRASNFYVYPQGDHQISAGDMTILNALRSMGFVWARKAGAKLSVPALCTTDQMMCMPIIGHAFADSNASIQTEIDGLISNGYTGILMFHKVLNAGAAASTDISTADFQTLMAYANQKRLQGLIDVVTVSEWYTGLTQPALVA